MAIRRTQVRKARARRKSKVLYLRPPVVAIDVTDTNRVAFFTEPARMRSVMVIEDDEWDTVTTPARMHFPDITFAVHTRNGIFEGLHMAFGHIDPTNILASRVRVPNPDNNEYIATRLHLVSAHDSVCLGDAMGRVRAGKLDPIMAFWGSSFEAYRDDIRSAVATRRVATVSKQVVFDWLVDIVHGRRYNGRR